MCRIGPRSERVRLGGSRRTSNSSLSLSLTRATRLHNTRRDFWLVRAYAFFLTLAIVLIIIILDSTYYACCFGMGGTILCSPSLRPFSIGAAAGLEIVQVVRCVEVYRKLVQFHPRGGGNGEAIVGGV